MNSLEALDELSLMINREKHINSELNKKINDLKQTIKQDLERLEVLEIENEQLKGNEDIVSNYAYSLKEENEKLKKAIEILKETLWLNVSQSVNGRYYIDCTPFDYKQITQQEYELLKEVLGA